MEFLQGRALTNAIGNLGLLDPYADALKKLGYELEDIAEQVCDSVMHTQSLCEDLILYSLYFSRA